MTVAPVVERLLRPEFAVARRIGNRSVRPCITPDMRPSSLHFPLCLLAAAALGCGDPAPDADDSSSSEGGSATATTASTSTASTSTASTTTASTTTASSTTDDTSDSSESSSADSEDTGDSSGDASTGDASTGGPTNDCTNEKDPCVLELDTPANGQGGVDQFYVYVVESGTEHVTYDAPADDYVSWWSEPWAFACNLDGPCCVSDGATTCDKSLVLESVVLPVGATAYVFVNASAAYEVAITSG